MSAGGGDDLEARRRMWRRVEVVLGFDKIVAGGQGIATVVGFGVGGGVGGVLGTSSRPAAGDRHEADGRGRARGRRLGTSLRPAAAASSR